MPGLAHFMAQYDHEHTSGWNKLLHGIGIPLIFAGIISLILMKWIWGGALFIGGWTLLFLGIVLLLCCSQLAVAVMNWLSTLLVKPRLLPRLDYASGITPDCRTMVAVPTLLTSPETMPPL